MTCTEIRLLGGFELVTDGEAVELPPIAQRLVAYVALQERPIARTVLAGSLWPETSDAKAATNLRAVLTRVKSRGGDVIASTKSSVAIDPSVHVDVHQASRLARCLLAAEADPSTIDHRAFTGVLLPEIIDSWVIIEREQLRQLFVHALERLSERLVGVGHSDRAIHAALAAVNVDPLRESSTRVLIQAHLAEGNWGEAWRAFDIYRETAEIELGIPPSAELTRLIGADLAERRATGHDPVTHRLR